MLSSVFSEILSGKEIPVPRPVQPPIIPFKKNNEVLTLSDLYKEDVPEGSLMITQYPTSCPLYADNVQPNKFFMNESAFNIHDHFEPPESRCYNELVPHRIAAVLGGHLRLYCAAQPSEQISRHWARKLGENVAWKWGLPGQTTLPHIVLFPLEKLKPELHAVDPVKHLHVWSKFFIPEIPCAQARVQNPLNPRFPCVVKAAHGAGSEGTFVVQSQHEYAAVMTHIRNKEPDCGVIVTDMIQNIIANYCCQFYVSKKGEMRWLGVTEQFMDAEKGLWTGACVSTGKQASLEQRLKPTLVPVAKKLHEWTYFGVVGVDVLVAEDGSQYVIDINPRINGSTPLLLASKTLARRGWDEGIFITSIKYHGTLTDLISLAESASPTGEMIVFSASEKVAGEVVCQVGVFSNGLEECRRLYQNVFAQTKNA